MVAPPCPVVDADDIEWLSRYLGSSAYDPEQRFAIALGAGTAAVVAMPPQLEGTHWL